MRGREVGNADAEQAIGGAIRLAFQGIARHAEDAVGKLCRRFQRGAARLELEIRGLELEHDGAPGECVALGPRGNAFGLPPQHAFEIFEFGKIVEEGRFR